MLQHKAAESLSELPLNESFTAREKRRRPARIVSLCPFVVGAHGLTGFAQKAGRHTFPLTVEEKKNE